MLERPRQTISFEEFELDTAHRKLLREGDTISLNAKTFDLLTFLVENNGKILSKDEILEGVWAGQFVEEANLSVQISALRKALGETAVDPRFLITVPGKGYKFVADILSGDSELVIEKHSLSKIVIEEETDDERVMDARPVNSNFSAENDQLNNLSSSHSSKPWKKIVALSAGALGFLLLILGGNWFYQNRSQKAVIPAGESSEPMTITRISNNGRVAASSISPDGKFVIYTQHAYAGEGTIFIQQLGTKTVRRLVKPANRTFGCTNFSPDGSLVYYVASDKSYPDKALYSLPVLGGTPKLIVSNLGRCFALSPDGKRVAFLRRDSKVKQTSIMIATLEGNEKVLLASSNDELIFGRGIAWSRDGKFITFGADPEPNDGVSKKALFRVDIQSGEKKQISDERFLGIAKMVWTKDGRKLVFIGKRLNDERQIHLMDYPSGEVRRVTGEMGHFVYSGLGITDDSGAIVADLIERKEEIWRVEADGDASRAVRIKSGTSNGRLGITTLPDGRIAYISGRPTSLDIWTANEDGTDAKALTTDEFRNEDVAASPDGRFLVFASNRGGGIHIFRIDASDGSQIKQLTSGERTNDHPSVSPDGKWVLYSSWDGNQTTVWKVSIDGGKPIRLTDYESGLPVFSPDGKAIACVLLSDSPAKLSTIAIIPAEGGKPIKSFQVKPYQDYDYPIHWTSDGKKITFANWHEGAFNLWQQPISGGKPSQLVDFPTGSTWNFAYSQNGKNIFLSRGTTFIDVIMIKNFLNAPAKNE